ncbi:Cdc37 N terminal kinase binding-domain-containing protein [Scheffersomyces amazonensis]|uniref:Cdc37 N terminal kinase binding-domain-containing protein n=1 Tax=Scheffersomyces amazonensis TaxID=1078765 RepID=UPI00315DC123
MPIDYSKWDKIELSDDSDIEVHPNVDKKSFIKWKQRDIHEKRQQRNIEIKTILIQLTMYSKLNERVDYILNNLPKPVLLSNHEVLTFLNQKFDKNEKFDYNKLISEKGDNLRKGLKDLVFEPEEVQNTPPYNEMVEDLLIQIKDDHPDHKEDAEKIIEYLKEHRAKIDDVLSKQTIKLDELLYQKSLLISSDDYHTGFDRSFLNKDKSEEEVAPSKSTSTSTTKKVTTTTIETINEPSSATTTPQQVQKSDKDILDELELLPETSEFANIKSLDDCASYLLKHTHICSEQQKDALIMTAFDLQLEGKSNQAKQVIHQSLLLQYISQLAGPHPNRDQIIKAIKLFISKLEETRSPAQLAFLQDVDNTFNHIKTRCEVIKSEYNSNNENGELGDGDGDEEALIQLKALDDNTQLSVNIPQPGTSEYEIFTTKLSLEMQQAVETKSLDEVNKVFAKLKVEDAEQVLEIFNECGVIGITGYLENEDEFKELQKQYNEAETETETPQVNELSIEDTVD